MVQDLFDWWGRVHIGRWNDRDLWQQAVRKKAIAWLEHTPKIKGSTCNVMAWQQAGLLFGLQGEISVPTYMHMCSELASVPPEDVNPEHLLLAYSLSITPANIENFVDRFANVTIPYRSTVPNIRFVDTLGMVVPYLHLTNRNERAKKQIDEYDAALWNGLYPAHAFDLKKNLPLGVFDWSRGCGWYILALVEAVAVEGNAERIIKLAKSLLSLQREHGGFGSFLFVDSSRMESSGTVMIGILMVRAYELTNNVDFLRAARKCEKALMMATRRDGTVDYCQGDTSGIGNYSNVFSFMPFVQGMTLFLCKKLNNYHSEGSDE